MKVMPLTKHKKLARCLQKILKGIESFNENVDKILKNFIVAPSFERNPIRPHEDTKSRRKCFLEHLLYCPAENEYSFPIDWFEIEDENDSLTYQFNNCIINHHEDKSIRRRIQILSPIPSYQEAIDLYTSDDFKTDELPPKHPASLWKHPLAPEPEDTIAIAWGKIFLCRKQKKNIQHRYDFIEVYEDSLKKAIFQDVNWNDSKKDFFLAEWKGNFFGTKKKPRRQKPGRWEQGQAIGHESAGRIIEYFVLNFIDDPQKKYFGEIACVLWICIWCGQECPDSKVNLKDIIMLTNDKFDTKQRLLVVSGNKIEVSQGLTNALSCLSTEGKGIRKRKLFPNISIKRIEREVSEVSRYLFPENETEILPSAFLIPTHPYGDIRLSHQQRMALKNNLPSKPPVNTWRKIKKWILANSQKQRS